MNNHCLFANRKSSHCVAQCPGAKFRKWSRHLVYASVYFCEYNKDLILMFIMSQLRTAFFFVFALFESLTLSKPLFSDMRCGNILALSIVTARPFSIKECAKMSVFFCENRKNSLAAVPPLYQILGAPLILHYIWAYYFCVDGTEMKDSNSLSRLIHISIKIIAVVCKPARFQWTHILSWKIL